MWLQMEQINYKNRIISFVSTLSIKFLKKKQFLLGYFTRTGYLNLDGRSLLY